ncbi:MAG TPA: twin-arginine translocation signal domain-containing protein, partial [Anaerolineaceae bacterium]|nr:twin-arginine translocation signal domain-containing protein [Anaerolineaceae bacterium]
MKFEQKVSRRDFLKLSGIVLGGLLLPRPKRSLANLFSQAEFPQGVNLGRICAGQEGAWFHLKTEPNVNAPDGKIVWRDDVVIWKREVVANQL